MTSDHKWQPMTTVDHVSLTTVDHVDRKQPPPPGGFLIYSVPSSRTVCKRTPLLMTTHDNQWPRVFGMITATWYWSLCMISHDYIGLASTSYTCIWYTYIWSVTTIYGKRSYTYIWYIYIWSVTTSYGKRSHHIHIYGSDHCMWRDRCMVVIAFVITCHT